MSVPKYKRSKSKLEVLEDAKKMVKYTITITGNEKIFSTSYKALIEDINHMAEKIFINAYTANNILAKTKLQVSKRIEFETMAILECNGLLALIDLAYGIFHLSSKRIEYWGNMIMEIRKKLQSWRTSEKERYQGLP